MKLLLQEAKLMRLLVDAMSAVALEVAIEIGENGFRAQARDQGSTWAVDVFIHKDEFATWDVAEKMTFMIDLKDFSDFVKTARANDELIVDYNEKDTLDLTLESTEITKNLALRLRDVGDFKFMRITERPFFATVEIKSELFGEAIKAAELGDEHVTMTLSKDKLYFEAKATSRKAEATINFEGNDSIDIIEFQDGEFTARDGQTHPIPDSHASTFGLKYLKHISKLGKSDNSFKLSMSHQNPLRIIIYPKGEETSYVAFAIAPRVRDSDN
ncbi:MAG: hypothetical protein ACW99A_08875 [Candidatus Kariarchaeaceae archaeon]|jgi:proliferating cell nuclear antigen PCNA